MKRQPRSANGQDNAMDRSRNKGQNCSINDKHPWPSCGIPCIASPGPVIVRVSRRFRFVAVVTGDEFVVLACDRVQVSSLITILEDTLSANLLQLLGLYKRADERMYRMKKDAMPNT